MATLAWKQSFWVSFASIDTYLLPEATLVFVP